MSAETIKGINPFGNKLPHGRVISDDLVNISYDTQLGDLPNVVSGQLAEAEAPTVDEPDSATPEAS